MDADAAIRAELYRLRRRLPDLSGAVLGGVDGLMVACDLTAGDPHHLAALSAATLGLGHRFAQSAGHGALHESVVRSAGGCVITYPAGAYGLLTLVTYPDSNVERIHPEARAAAQRLGTMVDSMRHATTMTTTIPTVDPTAPLAVRTPMATLPADLWAETGGLRPPGLH
ncbi:roadblock/LC7 domain-containing protein [Micromonospora sp. NBC_01699]|uniref:roadblock/LC7 domain-containing protein n=1 Tax=Micromonospora sp. NBC_01699 TaxID=2975984 RepID=UPI002E2D6B90|nr:roadblock/LC7 domain-containing protein [Micromonospora sp. NBC_01699]